MLGACINRLKFYFPIIFVGFVLSSAACANGLRDREVSIYQLISRLIESPPINHSIVETTIATGLTRDSDDIAFENFSIRDLSLKDAEIRSIEYSEPIVGGSAKVGPNLAIIFDASECIPRSEVLSRFGTLKLAANSSDAPIPSQLFPYYLTRDWGAVYFVFPASNRDCLGSIFFRMRLEEKP